MSDEKTAEEVIGAALHDPTPAKEAMLRGAEAMMKAMTHSCDVCGRPGAHEVIRFLRRADGTTRAGTRSAVNSVLCRDCAEEWNH